jgi:hypothetical protein
MPHGIFRVVNTNLYENEFQNPQIFQQTISLFPEHSTLVPPNVRSDLHLPMRVVSEGKDYYCWWLQEKKLDGHLKNAEFDCMQSWSKNHQ